MSVSTYKDVGVDLDATDAFVADIANKFGIQTGFAAVTDIGLTEQIVTSMDGVGTKARLALQYANDPRIDTLYGLGVDLVATVFNDIITTGATPKLLQDYYGAATFNPEHAHKIIEGIQSVLSLSGMPLLVGGETAVMKNTYLPDTFELIGSGVGIVSHTDQVDGRFIKTGHILLGIESSGPHTNGYTLIQEVLQQVDEKERHNMIPSFLKCSSVYIEPIRALRKRVFVYAMANITGGGLIDNIPRALPKKFQAVIEAKSWEWPEVFKWLQRKGNIPADEMYRVFNCGIGFVVVVQETDIEEATKIIRDYGFEVHPIGCVVPTITAENRCIIA